ncbi:MAG TPA: gliding motility-associated C-terminal domain-containing protein, partial [Bacteroidia bacterium]|nr:gliding motility-associated C-terminal domain-containing protein [Bacteroidia bacterium]
PVTVTINPLPVITVTSTNPTTCSGTDGTIAVSGLTPAATYTINYNKGGVAQAPSTLPADVTGTITISGLTQGAYTGIIATSASGCSSTAKSATLSDPTPFIPLASSNGPLCQGATLNLSTTTSADPTVTYSWTGPNAFAAVGAPQTITNVVVADGGTYTVTATHAGCTATSSIAVTIYPAPVLSITDPASVCSPSTVDITAPAVTAGSILPAGAVLSYYTDAAATIPMTNPAAIPASGTYYIKALIPSGCSDIKPVTVAVNPVPAPPGVSDVTYCQNVTASQLSATGSNLLWYSGPVGGTGSSIAPTPFTANTGITPTYFVTQTVGGCTSSRAKISVFILAPPTASINMPKLVQIYPNNNGGSGTIVLQGNASAGATVEWTTALANSILTPASQPDVTVKPQAPTGNDFDPLTVTTNYLLTATSAAGCTDTVSVNIEVIQQLQIPSIFSPNGDGTNETFDIGRIHEFPDVDVSIFNRYGQFIWESHGYAIPWDGNYNGQPLPVGTYFYIIKTTPDAKPIAGPISIVR